MQNSHKDNVRSSAVGKQLKQKKSNSLSIAQLHLPALELAWTRPICCLTIYHLTLYRVHNYSYNKVQIIAYRSGTQQLSDANQMFDKFTVRLRIFIVF